MKTKLFISISLFCLSGFFSMTAFSKTNVEIYPLEGIVIGTEGYRTPGAGDGQYYRKECAFDGSTATFFAPGGQYTTITWCGLAFLVPKTIDSIRFCPRSTNTRYVPYGRFEGANKMDFSDAVTIGTFSTDPEFKFHKINSTNTTKSFLFVRYFVPITEHAMADMAELEFYGKDVAGSVPLTKLTGIKTGSVGWGEDPLQFGAANAFDDDYSTLFASIDADGTGYLNYDLGANNKSVLKYAYIFHRDQNPENIVGAFLKGSNNADFSNATTILQIADFMYATGVLYPINIAEKYRYIKLLAPTNHELDAVEFHLYGVDSSISGIETPISDRMNLNIYPNPVTNSATISCKVQSADFVELTVMDLQGRVIQSVKERLNGELFVKTIDTNKFAAGSYLVQVKTGAGITTKKMIKD